MRNRCFSVPPVTRFSGTFTFTRFLRIHSSISSRSWSARWSSLSAFRFNALMRPTLTCACARYRFARACRFAAIPSHRAARFCSPAARCRSASARASRLASWARSALRSHTFQRRYCHATRARVDTARSRTLSSCFRRKFMGVMLTPTPVRPGGKPSRNPRPVNRGAPRTARPP